MKRNLEGGCECGAIRYQIDGEPVAVAACHCTQCQRQSGSAFSMSLVLARPALRWLADEPKRYLTRSDSGAAKECLFCGDCGVRICNLLERHPDTLNLKPGTLDDTSWLEPVVHVWLASKQPWTPIPDGVKRFERNPG